MPEAGMSDKQYPRIWSIGGETWDATHPKEPWSLNPWVWRIEFRRLEAAHGR